MDSQNEYEYILANDSFADAFFAVNDTIYFVKYNQDHFEDASLYQYDSSKGIASKLCSSGFYGSIVGAEGGKVYFLQISNEDAWGNELISYNIEKDEKTVLAENVGKAYFWNGSVIYTGYASDISPVAIYRMDTNGNRELITENGSQNLYVDYEEAYYIDYKMTNNISWEQASVNRITENTIEELSGLSGSYITPEIHGKIDDYLLVSCNQDNTNHYYQIDTAASEGNIYEMDVPENATYMSLFQDEYRNRYYYANQKIFYWRGAGYECIAEIPPDATVIGVMGGYVFYYVYSSTGNPKLIQTICK